MKKHRLLGILVALTMVLATVAGCTQPSAPAATTAPTEAPAATTEATAAPTLPAELEPITLKFMCPVWDVTAPMNDWWLWSEYEKKTKVHIEWEAIAQSAMAEKKSTLMASGDLPDAFWQYFSFTPAELAQYGSEGLFISLDDKMDKLPGLSKVIERIPSAKSSMTMPDGHIYAFPYIMEHPAEDSLRYYVNKKYLEQTGLKLPTTVEEFEALLKAFKDIKVGEQNVSPLYTYPGGFFWTTESQMMGSFGMGENGLQQVNSWTYAGPDGKLAFIYTDPKCKEMWQMFARWFKEGYIHPEEFTGTYDYAKWVADGTAGLVGTYSWVGANILYGDAPKDYVAINALKGPYSQTLSWIDAPLRAVINGIITNKCKEVDRALAWFDYWFTDEGSLFGTVGTEGVTYVMKDGKYSYTDEILNYEGGVQLGAFQRGLLVYGGFYPYIEPPLEVKLQLQNKTFEDVNSCTEADVYAYMPKELWPSFVATKDEQAELDTFWPDLSAYVTENRVKFITGELNFDADWDNFVNTLNGMGVDKYLAIKQAQYDRYKASK